MNIPVTQSLMSWMEKTGMIGSWSQDPGLVSKHITNIDKIIKIIRILNDVVLPSGRGISLYQTIVSSESRVTEKVQDKQL